MTAPARAGGPPVGCTVVLHGRRYRVAAVTPAADLPDWGRDLMARHGWTHRVDLKPPVGPRPRRPVAFALLTAAGDLVPAAPPEGASTC